jgi:hypothetical protein
VGDGGEGEEPHEGGLSVNKRRAPVLSLLRSLLVASRPLLGPALGLAALTVGGACGKVSHPPQLGDPLTDGGSVGFDTGGPSLFDGSGPVEKSCGTGPDGGVCACADEPLLGDPPTLYYVLDRSGSMQDNGKWSTIQIALEKVMIDLGPRAKVGAAVFPDPAQDNCAPGVEVFAPKRGDAPAGTAGPADTALLVTLGQIGANGGTPTAATLKALAPHIEGIGGKTYVILATDGGPNCNDSATCDYTTCTLNMDCTPPAQCPDPQQCPAQGPTNCCDPNAGVGTARNCLDAQPTIDEVTALASAGIPVYVVGVPGSEPYAKLLNQLAVAGGTARGSDPQYYAVDSADQTAFLAAMSQIAAKIAGSCTLTLDQAPPDPSLINVFLDGNVLPQSGPDGWTLTGTTVTILGKSCVAITNGDVLEVRVVAGCPTVTQ